MRELNPMTMSLKDEHLDCLAQYCRSYNYDVTILQIQLILTLNLQWQSVKSFC